MWIISLVNKIILIASSTLAVLVPEQNEPVFKKHGDVGPDLDSDSDYELISDPEVIPNDYE